LDDVVKILVSTLGYRFLKFEVYRVSPHHSWLFKLLCHRSQITTIFTPQATSRDLEVYGKILEFLRLCIGAAIVSLLAQKAITKIVQ
jgi:hypothetical protein